MSRITQPAVCALILFTAWGCNAQAQGANDPAGFAKHLVAAINTKDAERRKELAHPKSLACLNGNARTFFEEIFANQATPAIPPNYRSHVEAIPVGRPLLFEDKFDYPTRPTHNLKIDFDTGQYSSKTIVVQFAYDGGRWREVWACPKPETLRQMFTAREAKTRQREKVKALAGGTAEPLRAQIVRLALQGRKMDAIQQYRSASGEDLATAKDVVELLMSQQK